jgi:hypothetical protein
VALLSMAVPLYGRLAATLHLLNIVTYFVTNYVDRRTSDHADVPKPPSGKTSASGAPEPHTNAFALVFRRPYLLLIAFMLLLNATVDATGEYILGSIVTDAAQDRVASGNAAA